jgi:hypothetical protein
MPYMIQQSGFHVIQEKNNYDSGCGLTLFFKGGLLYQTQFKGAPISGE